MTSSAEAMPAPLTSRAYPFRAIFLLSLVGMLNYIDRVLPAILVEPIRRDLELSDTTIGLINGLGFLLIYGAASIPLARLSDQGLYNRIVVVCLALWSGMTFMGGWATSAAALAASRMGVALGEAGSVPATHAHIARHVPEKSRTITLAVFNLCLPSGSMIGFVVGGFAAERLGWRATFMLMGGLGLFLATACHFLLGKVPGHRAATKSKPKNMQLGLILAIPGLLPILAGSAFMAMGGYTGIAFSPAFLMRAHGLSLAEAGLTFGIVGGTTAIIGLLCTGWIANALAPRDPRWLPGTVILITLASLPLSIFAYSATDTRWALAGIAISHMISIAQVAPIFAAVHRLVPLSLRAQASALLLLAGAILGGVGPLTAGAISDFLTPQLGNQALARAMLVVPSAYLMAILCLTMSMVALRRERSGVYPDLSDTS